MDKSGLSVSVNDGRNVLKFNGRRIESTFDDYSDKFGVRVDGSSFKIDGCVVAQSSEKYPEVKPNNGLSFGEINVGQNECINITLSDYNKLLKGERVSGYAKFGQSRVYNIVDSISSAPKITYTDNGSTLTFSTGVTAKKMYCMIYNSFADALTENTENLNTTVMGDCPFVNMRYFDPIVKTGDGLLLEYFVDNKDMDSMNNFTIGDTFTTIIRLANGAEYKKTTYAGFHYIELPAFNTTGETWFSVRCVDQNGVSSVEQFFDFLVRNEVVENYYTMIDADLETYGITPNNNNIQVATANKAAFTAFFAAVKEGGYNGVILLKNTYWLDYHATFGTQRYWRATLNSEDKITALTEITEEDVVTNGYQTTRHSKVPAINDKCDDVLYKVNNMLTLVYNTSTSGSITIPNEFTVDLNSSTFRATQCDDLASGSIIYLNNNYDTHVKNGILIGNYDGFDFATTKRRTGTRVSAEGLNATRVSKNSRYCSLEGLDISYTVGYELMTDGIYGGFDYIDIETNGTENKRIDLSTGALTDESGCVVSQFVSLQNASKIALGRSGQGSYLGGTRRELLFSFYDTNKDYISTVKTKMYYEVKVPSNAVYARITGYGTKAQYPLYGGAGVLGLNRNPTYPTNIIYKNCSWHDTRTVALTISGCNGVLVKNCHWTNIALESGTYQVTKHLGDLEDGWQRTRNVFIHDCTAVAGNGMNSVSMTYCNKLEMVNCDGFSVISSGIEDGLVADNVLGTLTIGRDFRSMNPHVVYLRNTITTLSITYSDGSGNTYNTGHVDKVIPMIDSTIKNTCSYSDLLMRNSKNGVILID